MDDRVIGQIAHGRQQRQQQQILLGLLFLRESDFGDIGDRQQPQNGGYHAIISGHGLAGAGQHG